MEFSNTEKNLIALIGPMGVGKSTVGRILAQTLSCQFCDVDLEVEKQTGVDISWIFAKEGEEGFRKRESAILSEIISKSTNTVLATGGGVVLKPNNRSVLKNNCRWIVFLNASIETLLERTSNSNHRPLLQNDNRRDLLIKILYERLPFYQDLANISINTDELNVNQVVRSIMDQIS